MYKQGVILELRKKEAVVFNDHGEYDKIERIDGMYVGQAVEYKNTTNKNTKRLISAISAAAVFIAIFFSYGTFKDYNQQVFAYVTLDINPSMEFSIDKVNSVISLKPLNIDAENITKAINVRGKNIDTAIKDVISQLEKSGFMERKSDNIIVVSTSASGLWDKKDKRNTKIDQTREFVAQTVKNYTKSYVIVESIASTPEIRELSIEADISLGRYMLYKRAISEGYDISLQDAKTVPLMKLISYTKLEADKYDKADNVQKDLEDLSEKNTVALNNDVGKKNITPSPKSESPTFKPQVENVNNEPLTDKHEASKIPSSDSLQNELENDNLLPKVSSSALKNDEIQISTPVPELQKYDDKLPKSTPVVSKPKYDEEFSRPTPVASKPKYDGEVSKPTPDVTPLWEDKIAKPTHNSGEPVNDGELPKIQPGASIPKIDDTMDNEPNDVGPPLDEKIPKPTSCVKPPEHSQGRGPNFPDIDGPEGDEVIPKPFPDLPIPESTQKPKPDEESVEPEDNLEEQGHVPMQNRERVRNGFGRSF